MLIYKLYFLLMHRYVMKGEGRDINHHGKTITVGGRPALSREAFADMTQVDKYKESSLSI